MKNVNFTSAILGANVLCAEFDVEAAITAQSEKQKVGSKEAIEAAKNNIAERKLKEETVRIEQRLRNSESKEDNALKGLRMARIKEAAQKVYLKDVSEARKDLEATGNYETYDSAISKAEETREKAIEKGKRDIYGDDAWRY